MIGAGHNESAVRLAALAGDAQIGLDRVARGEADAVEGWLAYGAALNEGRALFAEDKAFGRWVAESLSSNLEVHPAEQSAAMWAAANADQLSEAKAACNARTLRGWHDQWKKIEQAREAERRKIEREAEEARKREEAQKAREEAAALEKVEADARAAAQAAKTEEERHEAEAKAETAATARAEAEQVAEEAEAKSIPVPEMDPAEAKLRREIARLTDEAKADEIIGLRADLAEAKVKLKKATSENLMLKGRIKELSQTGQGKTIAELQSREFRRAEELEKHQANVARANRQIRALEAENNRLKKEVENQVFTL